MKFKKWKRLIIAVLSLVMLFQATAVTALSASPSQAEYGTGCLRSTKAQLDKIPEVPDSALTTAALPSVVDLSKNFPTPGNQGQQGSCVAWAVAYAAKTYQEQLKRNWGQNTTNHQFSPAYIYNQINGGRDEGSDVPKAIKLVVEQGVCTLAAMPYNADDYKTQPNAAQRAEAAKYKSVDIGKTIGGDVEKMKKILASKQALVLDGIPIYPDFDNLKPGNEIFNNTDGTMRESTLHAVCLVGYDDNKQAFKLINSWGTDWGLNGYGYISYQLVKRFLMNTYSLYDTTNHFTVQFDSNGGTGSMPAWSLETMNTLLCPLNEDFTKTGHRYTGWNAYRKSDSKWYCVSADGRTYGWYTDAAKPSGYKKALVGDSETKGFIRETTEVGGDTITLYAQWAPNTYTVKYDPNGGNGTMADTTVTWGTQTPLRDLAFTKVGSTFTGWYAHRQSDNKWYYTNSSRVQGWYTEGSQPSGYYKALFSNKNIVSKSTEINDDVITMYAQWRKHTFTVKYNPNGGTGSMEDTTITYGNLSDTLRPNTFVKEGYSFKGWYLKKGKQWYYTPGGWLEEGEESVDAQKTLFADIRAISTITSEDKAVITAYAQWEKITLCYGDVNGDGSINSNDIILIQNYISMVAALKPDQIKRADVNADGQVSSLDVIAIQKYIAKQEHNSLTGTPVV